MRQGVVFLLYFDATAAASFLASVYEPSFTTSGGDDD